MIYSIISADDIFCAEPVKTELRAVKDGMVETELYGGRSRVRRLITTNQRMYLNPQYQPYTEICAE